MSSDAPTPNRRDFLSGRAVRQQVEHAGDVVADSLVDAGEHRPIPSSRDTVRLETSAMACQWAVVMNPGPPRQVMAASDALDIVHALEDQLTVYRDDSEVMRINREAASRPIAIEPNLFDLLQQCRQWSEETAGAFDPTSGPLIRLWRERRTAGEIPTAEEVSQSLQCVGINRVDLQSGARSVQFPVAGFSLDFGAVGKGFAIDQAAEHLLREEIADFLIHGGRSSLYAAGDHGGQGGWPVGIRNPLFTDQRYATVLLQNEGMSTSGSNIQYFRYQGRRFGHILDPRTGWPAHSPESAPSELSDSESGPRSTRPPDVAGSLLSVTVLCNSAARADALSTAFYVMGLEKAREYCHNHPDVGAILIPSPAGGRTLRPVLCNLSEDRLYFDASAVDGLSTAGQTTASPTDN